MTSPDDPMPPTVPPPPPPAPPGRAVADDASAGRHAPTGDPAPTGDHVPELDDRERPLDPRVVSVWRVSTAIAVLVPGAIVSAVAVAVLGGRAAVVPVVVLVLLAVLAGWYPKARYERWRWRLTELAVELERGVVFRRAEALPYFRIQQIDVTRGPVDRMLGLASLQVTSASASGSVSLPGIAADEAPGVRRALLARAAAAVGGHDSGVRDAV